MWKISVYCDDFLPGKKFFERSLALLSDLGIEYVELRLIDDKNLTNMTNDEVRSVKKTLKKYGMKVGGLGTPVFKCPLRGYDEPLWGSRHGYKKGNNGTGSAYEDHSEAFIADFPDIGYVGRC
jgi:sugar phosphate isomerase/epimerase